MTALTAPRNAPAYSPDVLPTKYSYPVADNVKIFPGAMIALSAAGLAQPAATALGLTIVGRYEGVQILDNTVTGHAASAFNVPVRAGSFLYVNGDTASIAAANRGQICYAVDDQTVALTDAGNTRSPAGIILDVSSAGVYILQGPNEAGQSMPPVYPRFSVTIPVPALSTVANAGIWGRFTPGVAGRLLSCSFFVTTAVTTAAKAATLTPAIAGTSTTGGAIALTSANCTPIGATVAGSAITALNTFTAAQEITVVASGVTAFVEGAGAIVLNFG